MTDDNNGSLREQKITVPNGSGNTGFTATQTYTYDNLNRLASATETVTGVQDPTWKQTFSYDRFGNRRFDANNTNTLGNCAEAVCNPAISTTNNRFSSGQGYSYDADGNLIEDAEGKRFGYDAENRQKEFFIASNSSSTPDAKYFYDGEGRRVKKITDTETVIFVYNAGGKLVAEYSTTTATTPQVSYLTTDHLGSPRIITNENGVITGRKDYTAFGEEIVTSQRTSPNRTDYTDLDEIRQGYTGYEKDEESELEYAQARYYNASHGRYTSVDPLTASASIRNPQSFNRYSYVLNSPYKFTDPLGLLPVSVACGGGCPNSGDYVDGSAFSGRDASLDWTKQQAEPPPPAQQNELIPLPPELLEIASKAEQTATDGSSYTLTPAEVEARIEFYTLVYNLAFNQGVRDGQQRDGMNVDTKEVQSETGKSKETGNETTSGGSATLGKDSSMTVSGSQTSSEKKSSGNKVSVRADVDSGVTEAAVDSANIATSRQKLVNKQSSVVRNVRRIDGSRARGRVNVSNSIDFMAKHIKTIGRFDGLTSYRRSRIYEP